MKKLLTVTALVMAVCMMPALGLAASPWTQQESSVDQSLHKLDFGVKNLLGGWTEIITVPMDYHKEGDSIAKGIGAGLWNALIYTGGGALHTATFFLPQLDVPLPNDGVQFN